MASYSTTAVGVKFASPVLPIATIKSMKKKTTSDPPLRKSPEKKTGTRMKIVGSKLATTFSTFAPFVRLTSVSAFETCPSTLLSSVE